MLLLFFRYEAYCFQKQKSQCLVICASSFPIQNGTRSKLSSLPFLTPFFFNGRNIKAWRPEFVQQNSILPVVWMNLETGWIIDYVWKCCSVVLSPTGMKGLKILTGLKSSDTLAPWKRERLVPRHTDETAWNKMQMITAVLRPLALKWRAKKFFQLGLASYSNIPQVESTSLLWNTTKCY